jgi:hypothetical protein
MAEHESTWTQLLTVPHDFLHGLLGGLFGPLLTLAGAIGLIYALTGQLPAVKEVTENDGTRHKVIALTSPLEARATWARYGGELRGAMLAYKARIQSRTQG